jgi:DNA gyrase/topoisomerase IV subunit A
VDYGLRSVSIRRPQREGRRTLLLPASPNSLQELTYGAFVRKELILFSRADTVRCIGNALDGLKPGQRKVRSCW